MGVRYPLTGLLAALHAAAILGAAFGWGRLLLRAAGPRTLPRGLAPLVAVGLGSGVLGYAAFALGLAGALRPRPLLLVLAAGLLLALPAVRGLRDARRAIRTLPSTPFARWCAAVAAVALLCAALGAALPEIEYDALWYHLPFPARYLAAGRLLDLPCEHMSPAPQQVELLYAHALVGGTRSAKFLHFGFGLLAAAAAGWLAARHLGRRWRLPAVAFTLLVPTLLWEMTTAYNELPLTLLATLAAALVLEWRRDGGRGRLALAGALLGIGLAGKHLAFFFLAPLALYVLLARGPAPRSPGRRLLDALAIGGVALLVPLPWYVRAWYHTGNPLFPMFYGVLARLGLPLARWDAKAEAGWAAAMARYGTGRAPLDLLLLPWRMTWDGTRFAGSLGVAWLALLPPLLLRRRRLSPAVRLLLLLAAVCFALWATPFSSFQVRYLVPAAPLLGVLAAASVRELRALMAEAGWPRARGLVTVTAAAALASGLPLLTPVHDARTGWIPNTIHTLDGPSVATALGLRSPERHLAYWVESYRAARWADRRLPPEARIVWFGEAAQHYVRAEVLQDYSRCVTEAVWGMEPGREEEAFAALRRAGVTHLAWDKTLRGVREDELAIRSPAFRRDHLTTVYEDRVIQLQALR